MKRDRRIFRQLWMFIFAVFICTAMSVPAWADKGTNVAAHTEAEIKAYLKNNNVRTSGSTTYAVQPSTSKPYSPGTLSDTTLKSALTTLNAVRYIAGLQPVSLSSDYNFFAQSAALVNRINGGLSHSPSQPEGMGDQLYLNGYNGASSSNLAAGHGSLNSAIIDWMDDGGVATLGHRRWILDPTMQSTGFGRVGSFSAMYVFDGVYNHWGTSSTYGVPWPARETPYAFFNGTAAWSYSYGSSLSASAVTVKLSRDSDGKVWNFSSTSADGTFDVNNSGYGQSGCVIFKPNSLGKYKNETFRVTIKNNGTILAYYKVHFFDGCTHEWNSGVITREPTCTTKGVRTYTCSVCNGTKTAEVPISDNHSWDSGKITKAATRAKKGVKTFTCSRCKTTKTEQVAVTASWYPETGALMISGSGPMENIVQNTMPDSSVWNMSTRSQIKKVFINEGITSIPQNAFSYFYKLNYVKLPSTVTKIPERAFAYCDALEEITIPPNINSIGKEAFYRCSNLSKITIPDSVTFIGEDILWTGWTWNGTSAHVTEATIYTTYNSTAHKYAVSNNVWYQIDMKAAGAKITGLQSQYELTGSSVRPEISVKIGNDTLPSSEYTVSYSSNDKAGTAKIKVTGDYHYRGTLTASFKIVQPRKGTQITDTDGDIYQIIVPGQQVALVKSTTSSAYVWIPDTVTLAGTAYQVTAIGEKAFAGSKTLKQVVIGNTVTSIGNNAFSGCTALEYVSIGNKVSSIGRQAFYGCSKLANLSIGTALLKTGSVGSEAFKGTAADISIKVPEGLVCTYGAVLNSSTGITTPAVLIQDGVSKAESAAGHSWNAGIVTKQATATTTGIRTYTCTVCKITRTETIPKLTPSVPQTPSTTATAGNGGTPATPASAGTASGGNTPATPLAAAIVEKAILNQTTDSDPAGSTFHLLQAKGTAKSKTSIKIKWKRVSGATGYVIYGNKCGRKNRYKKITTVSGTSFTQKKLKKGTYYKYLVVAVNGDKALATSKTIHVTTKGGKNGNYGKVTVKKSKVSLRVGKTSKIKAKAYAEAGGRKVKKHRGIRYESSNTSVATVTSKGVIRGVSKGTCYIYAYAQNGVCRKITVKVK